MPFGLCHAAATFQPLMARIFQEHIGKDVAAYLDDLLMYAFQFPQLLPVFGRTLGQLIEAGLKCKPRKCKIFPESIHYLLQVVCKGKIAADQSKLDKIRECPFPTMGTVMASLFGLCNYYRPLIAHFADDPLPLSQKIRSFVCS